MERSIQTRRQSYFIAIAIFIISSASGQNVEINNNGLFINSRHIYVGLNSDTLQNFINTPARITTVKKNTCLIYDSLGFVAIIDSANNVLKEFHLVIQENPEEGPVNNCGMVNFNGVYFNKSSPASMLSQSGIRFEHKGDGDYTYSIVNSTFVIHTLNNKTIKTISLIKEWKESGFEIFKIKGKKVIKFHEGDVVWLNSSGKKTNPYVLEEVQGHQLIFYPKSMKLENIERSDSTLTYIELSTFGSVIRGTIINVILVGAYAINYVIVPVVSVVGAIIIPIVTLGAESCPVYKPNNIYVGFNSFRKHIKLVKKSGKRVWGVRVIDYHSAY